MALVLHIKFTMFKMNRVLLNITSKYAKFYYLNCNGLSCAKNFLSVWIIVIRTYILSFL